MVKKGVRQGQMEGCAGGGQGSKMAVAPLKTMKMMKVTLRQTFLQVLQLTLSISFTIAMSSGERTIGPLVAAVRRHHLTPLT
jgi:hypothetical protein